MKKIVVTGSIAYDHLMTFKGVFSDSLMVDKLTALSVSFLADKHIQEFGGCAGNIAYSLKLLGCEPIILGVAGNDFEKYGRWLRENSISADYIFIDPDLVTASAYVLSDEKQSQISIFSPSAMNNLKDGLSLKDMDIKGLSCAIIAPEPPQRMMAFGKYFKEIGLPFVFDPGQAIPALSSDEIRVLMKDAIGLIANEYEIEMLEKKIGLSTSQMAGECDFLIKTTGERGCEIYENENVITIPTQANVEVVDATGCGDAFRAGFLSAYVEGLSLADSCRRANKVASFVISQRGTQKHKFTLAELGV